MRAIGRWVLRVLIVFAAAVTAVLVWAQFSPRPGVFAINLLFSLTSTGKVTETGPVPGVGGVTDLAYGVGEDETLDVWAPTDASESLPAIVWVHGGGWVGGDKSEVAPYLRLLAQHGFIGIGINYSLAPGQKYPEPVRQLGRALDWVQEHATEHGIDPDRIVLAGDSAGAHIAAQYAAIVTDPGYARDVGLDATVRPDQLRGTLLHCGPYDPPSAMGGSGFGGWFVRTVGWAYLGTKDFTDAKVEQASVVRHATAAFPPALVSGGDDDPLTKQGRAFVDRLGELGIDHEAYFYPGLNHEFQFDLDLRESQEVLDAQVDFLARLDDVAE